MSTNEILATLGLDPGAPASALTVGQLVDALAAALRPPSPYDRLTPAEVQAELRVRKTKYYELLAGNVIRQIEDPNTGTVFVTRIELDRYKRETGSRPGPIANATAPKGRGASNVTPLHLRRVG